MNVEELNVYIPGGPAIDTPMGIGSARFEIRDSYEILPARAQGVLEQKTGNGRFG
jgi:hypothetical protein